MKKYIALALTCAITLSSTTAIFATTLNTNYPIENVTINKENSFTINGITYTITQQQNETLKGFVTISDGSNFKNKELSISDVSYQGKNYIVESISPSAFNKNKFIEKVNIPATIKNIGLNAFLDCENLKEITVMSNSNKYASVDGVLFNANKDTLITYPAGKVNKVYNLPNNVKNISQGAFYKNQHLETLMANSSLEQISPYAFYNTRRLKEITGIIKLKTLGDYAFAHSSIENINLSTYLEKMGKATFYNSNIKHIEIPYRIKSIPEYSFYNTKNLKSISFKDGTTNIESFAFSQSGLEKFVAPSTLLSIDSSAFKNCNNLKDIVFNNSLTTIKDEAFAYSPKITKVILNRDLKDIGKNVFYGDNNIESIIDKDNTNFQIIENTLYTIDKKELVYIAPKRNKKELNIPKETISIREGAINSETAINKIIVDPKNEKFSSEDGILYDKDKKKIVKFPPKKEVVNLTILPSVEEINPYAFKDAINLSGFVNIHGKVKTIGKNAFDNTINIDGFIVDEYNENYCSIDGVLYNKDKTSLIKYPSRKNTNSFNIPNSIKSIEERAFENSMIESLTTNTNLSTIEKESFLNSNIKNIELNEGLKSIKENAFKGTKIKDIVLPSTLETIQDGAFSYMKDLNTIQFKSLQLKDLGYNVLMGSNKLEKIVVPINAYNNYKNYLIYSNFLEWQKFLQEYKPNNKK